MSQLFVSGGQSIGASASASVLPMNTQDWSPLGWTGWISLQSKGLPRVFPNTIVQKHQFFCAVIYLGPNYGGCNEDNGDLLQKVPCIYCYTHCPQPCSRPPPTHASTEDSWTLTGKYGSVSYGVTFSWVLVHTRFCLCPLRVCFPGLCEFWWLYCGLMVTSSMSAYAITKSAAPRALLLQQSMYLHRRLSNTVLSQSLWGLWVWCAQGLFEPSEQLWWEWGLILNVISPLLPSCRGFSALGRGVPPHSRSSTVQPQLCIIMVLRQLQMIFDYLIYTIYNFLQTCKKEVNMLKRSTHYFKGQEKHDLLEFISPKHGQLKPQLNFSYSGTIYSLLTICKALFHSYSMSFTRKNNSHFRLLK